MTYWVYWNDPTNRAIIHWERCSYIKLHGGEHAYGQGGWAERATYKDAFEFAKSKKKKITKICQICLRGREPIGL